MKMLADHVYEIFLNTEISLNTQLLELSNFEYLHNSIYDVNSEVGLITFRFILPIEDLIILDKSFLIEKINVINKGDFKAYYECTMCESKDHNSKNGRLIRFNISDVQFSDKYNERIFDLKEYEDLETSVHLKKELKCFMDYLVTKYY
jgi:hypothetical protein